MEPEMSEAGTDRILKLPRDVRQQILSLLCTKEAIATSVLSRSWRYAWLDLVHLELVPDFYRRKDKYGYCWYQKLCSFRHALKDDMLRFLEFLDQALIKRKSIHSDIIRKINLSLTLFDQLNSKLGSCLDKLRDQELILQINTYDHYEPFDNNVPWFVFTTQSITKLSINRGCSVTGAYEINLPFLRELSLWEVEIDDLMVGKLIAGCTAIECLELLHCYGFKLLNVSGLSRLKKFKQYTSRGLERVEINAPKLCHIDFIERKSETSELVLGDVRALTSLELCRWKASIEHWISSDIQQQLSHLKNFEIMNCSNVLEYIGNLTSSTLETLGIAHCENLDRFWICDCDKLTQLWLCTCDITDHWLNMLLQLELANLEVLKVEKCDQLEHIKIFHTRLHTFNLEGCKKLDQVAMDCPNLSNFSYCPLGNISSLSMEPTTLVSSTTIDLWHTSNWGGDKTWYADFLELLAELRHSKYVRLKVSFIEELKIPPELRRSHCPPLCEVDHLVLSMNSGEEPQPVAEIMDILLWLIPRPKSLHVIQCYSHVMDIFIKFTYKKTTELSVMNCGYCSSILPLSCWRHSVEDFKIIKAQGSLVAESWMEFLESAITREK